MRANTGIMGEPLKTSANLGKVKSREAANHVESRKQSLKKKQGPGDGAIHKTENVERKPTSNENMLSEGEGSKRRRANATKSELDKRLLRERCGLKNPLS